MDSHVRPAEGNQRRKLELDYLAVSHDISRLIEVRTHDRKVVQQISYLVDELSVARDGLDTTVNERIDELTLAVVTQIEASVRVGMRTSQFRSQFHALQMQLAELGAELGYT
jgi:hypothetical protein